MQETERRNNEVESLQREIDNLRQQLASRPEFIDNLSHEAAAQLVSELESEIAQKNEAIQKLTAERDEARTNAYDQPRDDRGRFTSAKRKRKSTKKSE